MAAYQWCFPHLSSLHSVSQKPKELRCPLANEFLFVSKLFLTWCLLPAIRTVPERKDATA